MLEFKEREIEVKLRDGEVVKLQFPLAKRMNDFMKDIHKIIKGETDKDDYEISVELLVEHGLSKKVANSLYAEDIKELIRVFDGQKKI